MRRAKIDELAKSMREARKLMAKSFTQSLFPGELIEIPIPKKYPVDFNEFLRLTVGGRHKARRLKIYRDYTKDMIWMGHVFNHQYKNGTAVMTGIEAEKLAEPVSLDEVETWIKKDKIALIDEGIYSIRARALLEWQAKQPSERGRKAAAKRWNKESPTNAK
jgi:hypothetical protein